ncbi:MAG: hypothetical protein ACLRSW_07580 [Christensenellaceae bacterium]
MGIDVTVGVGSSERAEGRRRSYAQAAGARVTRACFPARKRTFVQGIHAGEDAGGRAESKLAEYLAEMTDESAKEIFEDEEMVNTAEEFLRNSLNVSETSRNLYMHRILSYTDWTK